MRLRVESFVLDLYVWQSKIELEVRTDDVKPLEEILPAVTGQEPWWPRDILQVHLSNHTPPTPSSQQ